MFLQKYNHLQPPDAGAFSMVDLIIHRVTYFGTKISYTYLEV